MLVLNRRIGETVVIGDEVTVTVLAATGGQIRLGFDAPPNVSVHREEIYQKILRERYENEADENRPEVGNS